MCFDFLYNWNISYSKNSKRFNICLKFNVCNVFSMDYYPDRGFPCFPSVVRQMLGYSSQRRDKVRILTSAQSRVNGLLYVLLVLIVVFICNFSL